uniref:Cyclin-like domain-containing protein n=1 Tax=Walleye epidermal hyperplasia virus 2 TaxID=64461 RepID=Q9WHJ4_9RETR|nr:unknown [Walleye epidermal hyperplasia virus 2]
MASRFPEDQGTLGDDEDDDPGEGTSSQAFQTPPPPPPPPPVSVSPSYRPPIPVPSWSVRYFQQYDVALQPPGGPIPHHELYEVYEWMGDILTSELGGPTSWDLCYICFHQAYLYIQPQDRITCLLLAAACLLVSAVAANHQVPFVEAHQLVEYLGDVFDEEDIINYANMLLFLVTEIPAFHHEAVVDLLLQMPIHQYAREVVLVNAIDYLHISYRTGSPPGSCSRLVVAAAAVICAMNQTPFLPEVFHHVVALTGIPEDQINWAVSYLHDALLEADQRFHWIGMSMLEEPPMYADISDSGSLTSVSDDGEEDEEDEVII